MNTKHVSDWYKEAHEALEMLAKAETRIKELEAENKRLASLVEAADHLIKETP